MENQKELDWNQYEFITKYIYETLGGQNVAIEGWGRDCKVNGTSGVTHQVDVLTSETDGIKIFRTAIECKYWNKKVDKDIVMKLIMIITDANIQRGIIVSKNGYTPDAQQFAKHHNILIVQLKEAGKEYPKHQKELHLFDLITNIGVKMSRPEVTNIIAKDIEDQAISLDKMNEYQVVIESANEKKTSLFKEIMIFKDYLSVQKPSLSITKNYPYQNSVLHYQGETVKIKNITFTGRLTVTNTNHNHIFSIVDKVWLLMEKIFEEQTFIITEGGMIVDTTNHKV